VRRSDRPTKRRARIGPRWKPDSAGEQCGFTLIELLVALVLLTIGVMAMAQVLVVTDRHTGYARDETMAVNLAQEIREKILSETFADIPSIFDGADTNSPSTIHVPAALWAQHVRSNLGPNGRGQVEVDTHATDASVPASMARVRITVSWREGNKTLSVPLEFNIAKIGP
jgi:prepilin-type N-terminal cleavage/methylation domain-containing protein